MKEWQRDMLSKLDVSKIKQDEQNHLRHGHRNVSLESLHWSSHFQKYGTLFWKTMCLEGETSQKTHPLVAQKKTPPLNRGGAFESDVRCTFLVIYRPFFSARQSDVFYCSDSNETSHTFTNDQQVWQCKS